MKSLRATWIVPILAIVALSGCATNSRFEWGNYDSSLYVYSKHPDKLPVFEAALREAIQKGKAGGRIAPGLQAELGYCYLGEGKRAEALELFKAEVVSFPESRAFISKIIEQAPS